MSAGQRSKKSRKSVSPKIFSGTATGEPWALPRQCNKFQFTPPQAYFVRPTVPVFLEDAIDRLGSLTAPLSMLVIGDAMANCKVRELFADRKLLLFTAIKLVLLPIIGMAFIHQLGLSPMLTGVCLVMFATPVGSMTAMLAAGSGENAAIASRGVAVTTLLSVVTMPIVSMITGV